MQGKKDSNSSLAGAALGVQAIDSFSNIFEKLLQSAMSNPLCGVAVFVISVKLAQKAGILDSTDVIMLYGILLGAAGLEAANAIVTDITQITRLSGNTASATLLNPSGQVLVFSEKDNATVQALLQQLVKAKA